MFFTWRPRHSKWFTETSYQSRKKLESEIAYLGNHLEITSLGITKESLMENMNEAAA